MHNEISISTNASRATIDRALDKVQGRAKVRTLTSGDVMFIRREARRLARRWGQDGVSIIRLRLKPPSIRGSHSFDCTSCEVNFLRSRIWLFRRSEFPGKRAFGYLVRVIAPKGWKPRDRKCYEDERSHYGDGDEFRAAILRAAGDTEAAAEAEPTECVQLHINL